MPNNDDKSEREIIQDIISKSEDNFELKITYLSAGALLLSLTFIEKIVVLDNSKNIWLLLLGWIFLILTLVINLISHLISKIFLRLTQDDIDQKKPDSQRRSNYRRRLIWSESFNWGSSFFLIFGISLLFIFVSINATRRHTSINDSTKIILDPEKTTIIQISPSMNTQEKDSQQKPDRQNEGFTIPKPLLPGEQKGFTPPKPEPVKTPPPKQEPPNTPKK